MLKLAISLGKLLCGRMRGLHGKVQEPTIIWEIAGCWVRPVVRSGNDHRPAHSSQGECRMDHRHAFTFFIFDRLHTVNLSVITLVINGIVII